MRCAVKNCTSVERAKNNPLSFHRFPHILDLKSKWISALGLEQNLINQRSRVCSKHFREEDFIGNTCTSRRLFPSAVPYINPVHDEIFPHRLDIKSKWISALGLEPDLVNKRSVVCAKHFREEDFIGNTFTSRRLFPSAVPYINPVCDEIFPIISDLKNKWISTLKLEKDLVNTTGVVCSNHFLEKDFIGDPKVGRRRLFPCAIPYLGPEHDFDDKSVDPLCINNFVETLLEGIEGVKEQQEEKEQTEDEKQEEKEKNVEEENLQIIQNIQIAPPTNQNIDLHTQNDYSLYLHPSPTLTLPSLIKPSEKENLQHLDKTEGERKRNVNTRNILSQNTLKSSYNELLMLSPIKRAAQNESGNQKIALSTNNNTPDDSALWVPCTCVHSLPGESNRNVNTQNILSQNTLKSRYNELVMLSPIKRATQNESGNQKIELSKNNNTPDDPALCSVPFSRVHPLPAATKVMSESNDELLAQKSADQEKIRKLEFKLVQKNKKIKVLNEKVRRRTKRVKNLIQTIKIIKNNSLLNEETSAILQKCLGEDDLVEVLWP